jgi:hypothetical protein
MPRPEFITNEDISRWSENLDNDENLSEALRQNPVIREVCYAGIWLYEELEKLLCPPEMITRIQYTAGKLSFGRDPWVVHQEMVQAYQDNTLDYEVDPAELN